MKVVINRCYGGFGLSFRANEMLDALKCRTIGLNEFDNYEKRCDPDLVKVVEELGQDANALFADLAVVEIPDDRYFIYEYDGIETLLTPSTIEWITQKEN